MSEDEIAIISSAEPQQCYTIDSVIVSQCNAILEIGLVAITYVCAIMSFCVLVQSRFVGPALDQASRVSEAG